MSVAAPSMRKSSSAIIAVARFRSVSSLTLTSTLSAELRNPCMCRQHGDPAIAHHGFVCPSRTPRQRDRSPHGISAHSRAGAAMADANASWIAASRAAISCSVVFRHAVCAHGACRRRWHRRRWLPPTCREGCRRAREATAYRRPRPHISSCRWSDGQPCQQVRAPTAPSTAAAPTAPWCGSLAAQLGQKRVSTAGRGTVITPSPSRWPRCSLRPEQDRFDRTACRCRRDAGAASGRRCPERRRPSCRCNRVPCRLRRCRRCRMAGSGFTSATICTDVIGLPVSLCDELMPRSRPPHR